MEEPDVMQTVWAVIQILLQSAESVHAQEVASILKLMENATCAETTSKRQEKIVKEQIAKTARHVQMDIQLMVKDYA